MNRKILAFGAGLAVLAAALMTMLAALDVITTDQLGESLPRLLGVVGIGTIAALVALRLGQLAKKK